MRDTVRVQRLDGEEFSQNPAAVRAFFDRLIAIVALGTPPPGNEDDPHARAFTDIWKRWCEGMSSLWRARTAANWVDWFNSFPVALEHRRAGRMLSIEEYLKIRDITGGTWLELDAIERVGHYEIAPEILESVPFRRMRLITGRVVSITQDVQSLAKEEAAGESNNMVLVVQHDLGLSRDEALLHTHRDIRRYTDQFLTEEATVPEVLDGLRIPVEDRIVVYQCIAGMRTLMTADIDWCATVARYR